ncbi:conserved protein of unknown function (plasmid) [Paraburkholderia dioscoreae]|uniref:Uncharacterized protein n=1 Tax=Paraburkholderia dioscoreae TaxID=2604047 RepID=A0A5Q4YWM8_9BURK|nr:conserved protein of unknown function [Paraburkholderia dioscoreae]
MTHVRALDDIDNEFSDVRRMVANTLDGLGDEQIVEPDGYAPGVFHHVGHELADKRAKLFVDGLVVADNLRCGDSIQSRECIQRPAQDVRRHFPRQLDFGDVDGPRCAVCGDASRAFRNLAGLVPGALEIGDGLRSSHQQPEVFGGWLATSDDVAQLFIYLDFHRVQAMLVGDNLLNNIEVEGVQRLHRTSNLLFHQAAHLEQPGGYQIEVGVELAGEVLVGHFRSLAEAAGNVILARFLGRLRENLLGSAELNELPQMHERRVFRDAGRLLHVVSDDDDRVVFAQRMQQVFNLAGCYRVQRGSRFVQKQHFGVDGKRPGNTQALLLAPGER